MGWSEREKRLGLLLALFVVVSISLVCYMFFGREEPPAATFPVFEESEAASSPTVADATNMPGQEEAPVVVDIKGAVKRPGVYTLPAGSRVVDAVERAGGFLDDADPERINLAQPLSDGMAFRVPFLGEEREPAASPVPILEAGSSFGFSGGSAKININTATAAELDTLPGIGPAKAEAIIQYRTEHGPFQHVDQLLEVPGIGEKTLQNLRELITVH